MEAYCDKCPKCRALFWALEIPDIIRSTHYSLGSDWGDRLYIEKDLSPWEADKCLVRRKVIKSL